jgi:hypothetical protein
LDQLLDIYIFVGKALYRTTELDRERYLNVMYISREKISTQKLISSFGPHLKKKKKQFLLYVVKVSPVIQSHQAYLTSGLFFKPCFTVLRNKISVNFEWVIF